MLKKKLKFKFIVTHNFLYITHKYMLSVMIFLNFLCVTTKGICVIILKLSCYNRSKSIPLKLKLC